MDRVRGGVFSGAMVLAGLSATLLSALVAIGIRQATTAATHPVPVTVQPASGQVAVPDATPTPKAASTPTPVDSSVTYSDAPVTVPRRTTTTSGTTTGSKTAGATTAGATTSSSTSTSTQQQPATAVVAGSGSATPSPSPSPTTKGKGNGQGAGHGGGGNGHGH